MNYFLQDVVTYLFQKNKGDFRKTWVVFPNRRARLFFNKYLSGLTEKPIWSPKYYSISDFVIKYSGLKVSDPLSLIFKLYRIFIEVTHSNESFDSFYHYCEIILSDFDELDKNCIDAKSLYKNLSEIKEFENQYDYLSEHQLEIIKEFWGIFIATNHSEEKQQFIDFWNALKDIYLKFNESLNREGLAYEGKAYRWLADQIKEKNFDFPDDIEIAFVGFNALNKAEEILFKFFKNRGNALFFWDFDEFYMKSEIREAGLFLRKYIPMFPPPGDFKSNTFLKNAENEIISYSVPSNISQSKILARCMLDCSVDTISDPGQTAIVLADESMLLPVITSLPANLKQVNISMGYPVLDTPVFNFINLLTDLQGRMKMDEHTKKNKVYHYDYLNIMNHSYLSDISMQSDYLLFKKNMQEKNLNYIDPDSFQTDNELYKRVFSPVGEPKLFGEYLKQILELIVTSILSTKEISKEIQWHLEVIYSIFKVLTRFNALVNDQEIRLNLNTTFSLFKKILKTISVPFSGEPLTGLQIMGILETRTLDFENIIILSMNEGIFPHSSSHNTFIPYSLREGFGLNTVKHQDAIYAYYFYRLLHRAKKVVLVHNAKSEGLQKGEPSRYIMQLKYDSKFTLREMDLGYKINPVESFIIKAKKDEATIKKMHSYLRPSGNNVLSPSAFNTYLNCSLRFYYRYIKGLKEPELIEEDIENNVFGSILHKAMKLIYSDYEGKIVNEVDIKNLLSAENQIRTKIDQAFAEEFFHKNEIDQDELQGRNVLIRKVIEKYIMGILKFDLKQTPFQIIALEKTFTYHHKFSEDNVIITLGGNIDRLDRKDGLYRVIDYKTGKLKNKFQDIESLFVEIPSKRNDAVFQTFLYALILNRTGNYSDILPGLFFLRNIHQSNFDFTIKMGKETIRNFNDISGSFEVFLNQKLKEFMDPDQAFHQTDDFKYCLNCPYNCICRNKN